MQAIRVFEVASDGSSKKELFLGLKSLLAGRSLQAADSLGWPNLNLIETGNLVLIQKPFEKKKKSKGLPPEKPIWLLSCRF